MAYYFDFLSLEQSPRVVVTDSGGVQEETTFFGIPCVTVRDNTERPITITHGTNVLVGRDPDRLLPAAREGLISPPPELWDGHAGDRIADVLHGVLRA